MENQFKNSEIEVITAKYAKSKGGSGKYLNKHIAPGHMYVIEGDNNLMGSCLYNIDSSMMVITYKTYEQFLKEATKSEIEANLTKSNKGKIVITDEMIAEKQLELVDKAIKIMPGLKAMNDMDFFEFCLQMKGRKVVLIDDYQSIVEDWYQESPSESIQTVLQRITKEYGIIVIAQTCPSIIMEDEKQVEMPEPVLWITFRKSMVNPFVRMMIGVFRMKDDREIVDIGTSFKRNLESSRFYIVEKKREIAYPFYYSLVEPSAVFTTKSPAQFVFELLLTKVESMNEYHTGSIDLDDIIKNASVFENRPMRINNYGFQSIAELCKKCRQMKTEYRIQYVVIDDFQQLLVSKCMHEGRIEFDEVYEQLSQLAKKLDIVVVAFNSSSTDSEESQPVPQKKRKHRQPKGLDAVLKARYAE